MFLNLSVCAFGIAFSSISLIYVFLNWYLCVSVFLCLCICIRRIAVSSISLISRTRKTAAADKGRRFYPPLHLFIFLNILICILILVYICIYLYLYISIDLYTYICLFTETLISFGDKKTLFLQLRKNCKSETQKGISIAQGQI